MADNQKDKELPVMSDFDVEDTLLSQLQDQDDKPDDKDDKTDDDASSKDDDDQHDDKPDDKTDDDTDDKSDDDDDKKDDDDDSSDDDTDDKDDDQDDKDQDDDKDDDQDDQDDGSFWGDVEKLTGRQVEVEYGDVDPETPEGAALREEQLVQNAITDHLNYLGKLHPKEMRALEHAHNGGAMEDLFTPGEPDYSKMEIPEEDEDYQKQFMQNFYEKKGFTRQRAARMVEGDAESEEGIHKIATDALKELATDQVKKRETVMNNQKQIAAQNRREDLQMIGVVEKVVEAGKLGNFTLPTKERQSYFNYALNHMQRNPEGGYMFVLPVIPEKMEQQLQEMYFSFKEGNLKGIIQREAETQNSRKLRRNAQKSKGKGSDETDTKTKKGLPTMDDHTVE